MWILLPAVSLAIVHIAGDNLAVVPDAVATIGRDIYLTTVLAYMVIGTIIAALSAWVGITTGRDLTVIVKKLFGCDGKKALAVAILLICLPASCLTGGHFSGWVLHSLTGLPHQAAVVICLIVFALLAAEFGEVVLKVSNYLTLLLIPMAIVMVSISRPIAGFSRVEFGTVNWELAIALVGYNAGGMRLPLVVEAAAYLSRKGYKAVYLAALAKLVEGLVTLLLAHVVFINNVQGPMALTGAADKLFNSTWANVFNVVVLCTFTNTMAPAMMVNARQIVTLTQCSFRQALLLAVLVTIALSLLGVPMLLQLLSINGAVMAVFIGAIAYTLHRKRTKLS